MRYEKHSDKIIIYGLEEFNIEHILLCGQVFRFENISEGKWVVYSADKRAVVEEHRADNVATIYTDDTGYFENYFDLKTSYSEIQNRLRDMNLDFLNKAIDKYYGIRILRQDIFETFFSFLISSNNNIKRIQKIIRTLCENLGEQVDGKDYKAFPGYERLRQATQEQLMDYGLGYRAKYFVETLKIMESNTLEDMKKLSCKEIKQNLMKFCGVGEKVADCVLLFGYGQADSFPCDVWIEKMYNKYFGQETNRNKISENLVKYFGDLSGYAQQYLFYYIKTELVQK